MKSSKSTQTVQRRGVKHAETDAVFPALNSHDPLASAAERIVQAIRGVEDRIVKAFQNPNDVSGQSFYPGGMASGPMTADTLDRYVRYRVAAVTNAALREAEACVVEELVRIAQLVPHGGEGYTYPRAQIGAVPHQQQAHAASLRGGADAIVSEPSFVERPAPPLRPSESHAVTTESLPAATGRSGLDVIKLAQRSQRRRQVLDFEELDGGGDADELVDSADIVSTPPRAQFPANTNAIARETHHSRMVSLAALSRTLHEPPGIADLYQRGSSAQPFHPTYMASSKTQNQQHSGALRSMRAQTYANVLQRALLAD